MLYITILLSSFTTLIPPPSVTHISNTLKALAYSTEWKTKEKVLDELRENILQALTIATANSPAFLS